MILPMDMCKAFNSLRRPFILQAFKERDCPTDAYWLLQSFFEGRRVVLRFGDGHFVEVKSESGIGQGTVLGPPCWNVSFDV